jgi:hypothetical protein
MIKITQDGKLLAIIIKAKQQAELDGFVTGKDSPLQLGCLKFEKDQQVTPHEHRSLTKTTHMNQEFIYIVKGEVKAEFYFKNKIIAQDILKSGDMMLQMAGGHGFTFIKPTKIVTIKQGPYSSRKEEKIELHP